jgi:hypothetical protein
MKGNVYISVPAADKTNSLPASITSYDWVEYTYADDGSVDSSTTVHPTWEQYGDKYKPDYGSPIAVSVSGIEYIVYELTASWKDSEVSALVSLGSGSSEPNYTLMTNEEAQQFISDNAE